MSDSLQKLRDRVSALIRHYDHVGAHGVVGHFDEIADRIDALLAEREPVMEVHKNSAGQISLRTPNGDAWGMSKHVGLTFYKGIEDE